MAKYKVLDNIEIHDQQAWPIVTGTADFTCDRKMGQYYAAEKTATIMKGRVTRIDVSKALALPGVKGFVTADDVPTWNKNIYFYGQPVCGIIADNWYVAIRATGLVDVTYEESKDAIFDPDEALKAWEQGREDKIAGTFGGTNVLQSSNTERGRGGINGLKSAKNQIDCEFGWTVSHAHNELEPHSALAWWIGDQLYFIVGTQYIHGIRASLTAALGLPLNKVHAMTRFNCGGFGGKAVEDEAPIVAAAMSRKLNGHPVLLKHTRRTNILTKKRQFSTRSKISIGYDDDGTFQAIDARFYSNMGVDTWFCNGDSEFGLRTTYRIPNASFASYVVSTNAPERKYWRCVQDPPAAMNYDSAIDKLAYKLNMDPYKLRMKNILRKDEIDQDNGLYRGGFEYLEMFKQVHDAVDYDRKWFSPDTPKTVEEVLGSAYRGDKRLYGISICGHYDSHGQAQGYNRGGIIKMNTDGTCQVASGSTRGSCGGNTIICNITAEALGMKPEDVILGTWGNTDYSLDPGIQAGSSHTTGAGSAYYNAAKEVLYKVFNVAITMDPFKSIHNIKWTDLESEDSIIYYAKDHTKKLTFAEVMAVAPPIAGASNGWASTTKGGQNEMGQWTGGAYRDKFNVIKKGDPVNTYGGAVACAEIAVDTETGEVEILHYYNLVDTGTSIFKHGVLKEIGTGSELVHAQSFFFGDVYDEQTGALISTNYTEAQFPTYMDIKTEHHDNVDYQSDDVGGPFGCHGIGEPCVTNYSTVLCGIFNATGVWVDPDKGGMTPDKVLKALGKA